MDEVQRIAALLRTVFYYDAQTGIFTRLVATSKRVKVGDIAGSKNASGRLNIRLDGKRYQAHRLAWLYVYGAWPSLDLDHINGDPADNRMTNLREATDSQNQANSKKRKDNSAGRKGVSYYHPSRCWRAAINHKGRHYYLGQFSSPEAAHGAYAQAAQRLFGEFARAA